MIFKKNHYLLLLLAFLLASCAQPLKFNQKLILGYGTANAIMASTSVLLLNDKIDVMDAQNVINQSDLAVAGLDLVRKLAEKDLGLATMKLDASLTVIKALSDYVSEKEKK